MYGVEIEHFGIEHRKVRQLLAEPEISGYRGAYSTQWQLHSDGSVNREGLEVVSPILYDNDRSSEQVRTVTKVLRDNGGEVDYSCGLHVHQNMTSKRPMAVFKILDLYTRWQDAIDTILPRSRRTSEDHTEYCHPLTYNDMRATLFAANDASSWDQFIDDIAYWDRYRVVNVCSLHKYGTLEFRQHSGTLNANKIQHWKTLTKAMVNIGPRLLPEDYEDLDTTDIDSLTTLLRLPQATKDFYLRRRAELQGGGDTEDITQEFMETDRPEEPDYGYCEDCNDSLWDTCSNSECDGRRLCERCYREEVIAIEEENNLLEAEDGTDEDY